MSARQGLKTVLVEKNGYCGGAAVADLSGTICGLYLIQIDIGNKKATQIIHGFTEEFRKSLSDMGGLTEPQLCGNTHVNTFNPMMWKELADNFLKNAGVTCLYHSLVTSVYAQDNKINAIQVESSAGHCLIRAKRFIDASGDAVLISKLGLDYNRGDKGTKYPSMMFCLSHVDSKAFCRYFGNEAICPPDLTEKLTKAFANGTYTTPRNKNWVFPSPQKAVFLMTAHN